MDADWSDPKMHNCDYENGGCTGCTAIGMQAEEERYRKLFEFADELLRAVGDWEQEDTMPLYQEWAPKFVDLTTSWKDKLHER